MSIKDPALEIPDVDVVSELPQYSHLNTEKIKSGGDCV
jgi:hypothetical protein